MFSYLGNVKDEFLGLIRSTLCYDFPGDFLETAKDVNVRFYCLTHDDDSVYLLSNCDLVSVTRIML